jgi:hypothetical protein
MSHRLRPLRVFVLCCAAAAIAAPVSAQQPANPPAPAQPPGQAQPKPPAAAPAAPAAPAKPPAQAAQPALKDPVVATVNGQPVRLSELEVAQQSLPQQYRNMPLQAVFPALLDRIIDSKLVVQGFALGQAFAEFRRLGTQLLVAELGKLRLECVDLRHRLVEAFDDAIVGCAEQASGQRPQHENLDILKT